MTAITFSSQEAIIFKSLVKLTPRMSPMQYYNWHPIGSAIDALNETDYGTTREGADGSPRVLYVVTIIR